MSGLFIRGKKNGKGPDLCRIMVAVSGAVILFFLSFQCLGIFSPSNKIPADAKENFGLMAEAWNIIHSRYVDRQAVDPGSMTYGAISGMVAALGDTGHSIFLTPQMLKEEESLAKGSYKGIGVEITVKDGHVVIIAPIDGSPAQKAGLRPGEIITSVNHQDITGWTLIQVVSRISGPAGTRVTLGMFNPSTDQKREVTLLREDIAVNNVTWHRLPDTNLAHLRIAAFSIGVGDDLKTALKKIKSENLKGIILDLRNDPGGLLDEVISCASQFLMEGNVLLIKDARGTVLPVAAEKNGLTPHIPMVVLVNGGTASASEILAGALLDRQRAVLIGTTTFGTGTVLRQFPLSDGSALLLAIEEWLTPNGNTIWHKGITPDIVSRLPDGIQPLFPEAERAMTLQDIQKSKDTQLLSAFELLSRKTDQAHGLNRMPARKYSLSGMGAGP